MMKYVQLWKINKNNEIDPITKIQGETFSTLDEITKKLPDGAYTTLRTYQHDYALNITDHFNRLDETCKLAGYDLKIKKEILRNNLKKILQQTKNISDLRLRISIDLTESIGDIYISDEELSVPPSEAYLQGVDVITKKMHRDNPKAKMTGFLKSTSDLRQEMPQDINEILMLTADDKLLEGLSSNFFVIKDKNIYTEENDVLSGITRSTVFEIADLLGIPVIKEGIYLKDLPEVDEAFITSASRLVLPIRTIDKLPIGEQTPGLITQKLMTAFQEKIKKSIKKI
ncbi:MAG: aminotransferase class IV [Anaerolineae bacterium]|nr:aminotransferase class IV [Anaerolineae bacterium]